MMEISRPDSEPQHPRRLGRFRRVPLWIRRNKGWAAVISASLLAIIGFAVAAISLAKVQTDAAEADAEAANERAKAAEKRLAAAEAAARQSQRDSLLERLERLRLTPHSTSWNASTCWSEQAWELVSQAAALGIDDNLRNQAVATLIGLDARLAKPFREMPASSVVFDAEGKRLLMGGSPADHAYPAEGAKVWDSETKVVGQVSQHKEAGPVAFGPGGVPLQLVPREGPSLLLWNVTKQTLVNKFDFSPEQNRVAEWALNGHRLPLLAMTADGSFVAAAGITTDEKGVIAVWQGLSGKRLFQIPAQVAALAFSPEGKYLATGDDQGKITLWPVTKGGELEYIQASRLSIQCLAFSPDSRRLAVGDGGGTINIWRLGAILPPTPCPGSHDDVAALAFGPDGTLLASGGRSPAKLWDAGTGRLLLQIGCEEFITGLAFAGDAHRLAVSSRSAFSPGGVSVWNLDYGRGVQALRGLAAPVSKLGFSPDERFLAALSHDWQVAIWNLDSGHLAQILDAPHGVVGNAALAYSPDGKRLVISTGRQAKSWDIGTGRESGVWDLPNGSMDILAFHRTGKLLLFRMEKNHKQIACMVRALVEPKTVETVAEIKELEISDAKAPLDGSYIVVEAKVKGEVTIAGERRRLIAAFDPLTGSQIWPPPEMGKVEGSHSNVDPTGRVFAFRAEDKKINVVEMPGGQRLEFPDTELTALGPGGQLRVEPNRQPSSSQEYRYSLFRRGDRTPLLTLGRDFPATCVQFNVAGSHLAWANPDGTITLCDLEKIRQRLAEVGLGW